LKADGSKITLNNTQRLQNYNDSQYRVGWYLETGFDNFGTAYVKEYDPVNHLREMWYKPGDGLTYYFVEENVEFNDATFNQSYVWERPKCMYLSSVFSANGDTLSFLNKFEYSQNENETYLGRQLSYGSIRPVKYMFKKSKGKLIFVQVS
jgi:hypothetical protein